MGSAQQHLCLKWNKHYSSLLEVSEHLLHREALVDVTLACEGFSLKAHKLVLSACSPFFESIFVENPCQHPVVIMKGVSFADLRAIVDFMYHGEVSVARDQLSALLETAQMLQIRGLADDHNGNSEPGKNAVHDADCDATPRRKRKRKRNSTGSTSNDSSCSENEQECPVRTEDHRRSPPDVINIDDKENELPLNKEGDPCKPPSVSAMPDVQSPRGAQKPGSLVDGCARDIQNVEVKVEPSDLIEDSMEMEEERHRRRERQLAGCGDSADRLPQLPPAFSLTPVHPAPEHHRTSLVKSSCLPRSTLAPSRDHHFPESLSIVPVSEPIPSRVLPEPYCTRADLCSRNASMPLPDYHHHVPRTLSHQQQQQHYPQRMMGEMHPGREQQYPQHFRSVPHHQEGSSAGGGAADSSALVPFSVSSESSAGSLQDSSSQDVMMMNSVPFEEASGSTNTGGQSYQHEGAEGGSGGSYMMYGDTSGVPALPGPSGHHLDEQGQQQQQHHHHGNNSVRKVELCYIKMACGRTQLVVDGFLYGRHRCNPRGTEWRCCKRKKMGCTAMLFIEKGTERVLRMTQHMHPPDSIE